MDNLFIDLDFLGKDPNEIGEAGTIVARYELDNDNRHICLEVNGEKEDYYLEIVDYTVDSEGNYSDNGFSEPIYFEDIPKNEDDIMELVNNWLEQN